MTKYSVTGWCLGSLIGVGLLLSPAPTWVGVLWLIGVVSNVSYGVGKEVKKRHLE